MNSEKSIDKTIIKFLDTVENKVEECYQRFNSFLKWLAPSIQSRVIPYGIFILISIMMISPFFGAGFYDGHDSIFHHSQIMSYIDSLADGNLFGYLSTGILGSEMGISIRMMYSSLSHTVVGLLYHYFGQPLGLSVTVIYKFVYFITILLSGLSAYELALKTLKRRKSLAILVGVIYLINPYHFTNIFVRDAFAENFAYALIPFFFLSLEMLLEDSELKRFRVKSFMVLIFSTSALLLSHNITALYTVTFGVIYLIINLKRLFNSFKDYRFFVMAGCSVVATIILYSPIIIPLIVQSDLEFRVYKDVMGANINGLENYYNQTIIFFITSVEKSYIVPIGIMSIVALVLVIIREEKVLKKYRSLMSILIYLFVIAMVGVYYYYSGLLARSLIFLAVALLIFFFMDRGKTSRIREKQDILKVIGYSSLLLICICLMSIKDIWKFIPSVFLKIQFQFRLWTYAILFASLVLGSAIYEIGRKNYKIVKRGTAVAVLLALVCPRFVSGNGLNSYNTAKSVENVDRINAITAGWQYEYFTDELYRTEDYAKLPRIYHEVRASFFRTERVEIQPYAYNNATISSYEYKASIGGSFLITDITETTEVILPILYYHGYSLTKVDDVTPKDRAKLTNNHGLVSFNIEEGMEGRYELVFNGTRSLSIPQMSVLLLFIVFANGAYLCYIIKKGKEKPELNSLLE